MNIKCVKSHVKKAVGKVKAVAGNLVDNGSLTQKCMAGRSSDEKLLLSEDLNDEIGKLT